MIHELAADLLISKSRDPHFNLALEEWLLRNSSSQLALFLYCNRPSVILGRNQNPWIECDLEYTARHEIKLARRISGGGSVYHDSGNVNFTFIMPRQLYEPTRFLRYAADALAALGIKARVTERHNLFVGTKKVSGTAFMLTGKRALQHGTLLIDADLEKLRRALHPHPRRIETHAVVSVPDHVMNLSHVSPGLKSEHFASEIEAVLARHVTSLTRKTITEKDVSDVPLIQEYVKKQRDWEWIYGRTPTFVHKIPRDHDPTHPVELTVKHGRIFAVDGPPNCPKTRRLRNRIGAPYNVNGELP